MKYLVLKPIKAYGKRYERGEIVDSTQLRVPRILIGEHKITPIHAVSPSISPAPASPEAGSQDSNTKGLSVKLSFTKKQEG